MLKKIRLSPVHFHPQKSAGRSIQNPMNSRAIQTFWISFRFRRSIRLQIIPSVAQSIGKSFQILRLPIHPSLCRSHRQQSSPIQNSSDCLHSFAEWRDAPTNSGLGEWRKQLSIAHHFDVSWICCQKYKDQHLFVVIQLSNQAPNSVAENTDTTILSNIIWAKSAWRFGGCCEKPKIWDSYSILDLSIHYLRLSLHTHRVMSIPMTVVVLSSFCLLAPRRESDNHQEPIVAPRLYPLIT